MDESLAARLCAIPEVRVHFTVAEADTAIALGSGDLPVLGTPRLLAWLEFATVSVLLNQLPAGWTSVGVSVQVEHLRPTPVGGFVQTWAQISDVSGRRVTFAVGARSAAQRDVATGTIVRALVDSAEFLTRIAP